MQSMLDGRSILYGGDCRDSITRLDDCSIDAVVTDPPYALESIRKRFGGKNAAKAKADGMNGGFARLSGGFMGQQWDTGEVAFDVDFWSECWRVLKPGGHVAAFSSTRTYHRLAVAIEDAGFEIRDQLAWVYGTGFPKSHDVSKGIQRRRAEDVEPVRAICRVVRAAMDAKGVKSRDMTSEFGDCNARLIDHWAARDSDSQPSLPTPQQWATLRRVLGIDDSEIDAEVARLNARKGAASDEWTGADIVGEQTGATPGFGEYRFMAKDRTIRKPTDAAEQWAGWGTALKPAWEPICLARKPLAGTVADTVLEYGCGAINVAACRVGHEVRHASHTSLASCSGNSLGKAGTAEARRGTRGDKKEDRGRWPANILHDGSPEVAAAFPADKDGSAARFFYSAKADATDRAGSSHPTVKPVALMRWLCRLVTPRGGVVLDPFAGSGTTGEAAFVEGFRSVLFEREPQFQADIRQRMDLLFSGQEERGRKKVKAQGRLDLDAGPLFSR